MWNTGDVAKNRTSLSADKEAADAVRAIADARGISQTRVVSRLCRWLFQQSPAIQSAILGDVPETLTAEYATMLLEQMVKTRSQPPESFAADGVIRVTRQQAAQLAAEERARVEQQQQHPRRAKTG